MHSVSYEMNCRLVVADGKATPGIRRIDGVDDRAYLVMAGAGPPSTTVLGACDKTVDVGPAPAMTRKARTTHRLAQLGDAQQ